MNDKRLHALPSMGSPIAEADLHAYADGQLAAARRAEVETFLAAHPQDRARVDAWQAQRQALRSLLDPVLDEPLPLRLPLAPPARAWPWRALAAGIAVAVFSGGAAWIARGELDHDRIRAALAAAAQTPGARRQLCAAVAHAVYAPDMGRPVEVGGDNEKALVTWLTKRLGAPVSAPSLSALGYELVGAACCPAAPARWRCSCTARPTGSA